jgi:hypothetical protein
MFNPLIVSNTFLVSIDIQTHPMLFLLLKKYHEYGILIKTNSIGKMFYPNKRNVEIYLYIIN